MNRKILTFLLIAMTVIAICACGCTNSGNNSSNVSNQSSAKPLYVVGIDGEYPPYSFIEKDGSPKGFDVESVQWIADKMGFDVKIQSLAWDGMIPALMAKKIDMVYSGMTITPERKEQVNFSNPYLTINQSVASQNGSGLTLIDFKAGKGKIGAQRGTTGAIWVEENLVNKSVIPADALVIYDNFPMVASDLQNKRIDYAIYDRPSMVDAIEGKPLSIIGEIDTGEEYGVAIRKDDTELLSKINTGLDLLKKDPKWEELKKKYKIQ